MLRPSLAAALAFLTTASFAAAPQCPTLEAGGQTTNWGKNYRDYVTDAFLQVKTAAGVDQDVVLLNVNDVSPKNRGARMVNGTPLGAVPKGTEGLASDAVFYTFGIFELACDQAQLGFFMAHEMRHLKRGPDGKNHFQRVNECTRGLLQTWMNGTDLSAYSSNDAAIAAFHKAKDPEIASTCVLPVEREADAFAFELAPKLPWKVDGGKDPARDGRVQAFKNAERWLDALGEKQDDAGHGTAAARAAAAEAKAAEGLKRAHEAAEKAAGQSLP